MPTPSDTDLQYQSTPEGEPTLFYQGRYLYSRYKPVTHCVQQIRALKHQPKTLYLFFSPLLGYGYTELLAQMDPKTSFLLGLECDQNLMFSTQVANKDGVFNHPHSLIFRLANLEQIPTILASLPWHDFDYIIPVTINGGYTLFQTTYNTIFDRIQKILDEEKQNNNTLIYHSARWFQNSLINREFLTQTVEFLDLNHPVCVIGAGLSLEQDLAFLQKWQRKIILISVDTALKTLLQHNIHPDIIINLEAQFYNLYDFYTPLKKQAVMLFDLTTFPPSLRYPKTIKGCIFTPFAPNQLHEQWKEQELLPNQKLDASGSVSLMAIQIAQRISQHSLMLSGIDFYTIEGKSHARGTLFHELYLNQNTRLNPQPLWQYLPSYAFSQEPYRSSALMLNYKQELISLLQSSKLPYYQSKQNISLLGIPQKTKEELQAIWGELPSKPEVTDWIKISQNTKKIQNLIHWEKSELERWKQIASQLQQNTWTDQLATQLQERNWLYLDYQTQHKATFDLQQERHKPEFLNLLKTRLQNAIQLLSLESL